MIKNTRNMKFKRGSMFIFDDNIFKIISIEGENYITSSDDKNIINPWVFDIDDESDMKFVSKKKNPEYFL